MKKKLVFHLYCDKDWENNLSLKLHFVCLKHYLSIFDEILIVLSTDFESDVFLTDIKRKIITELNHKNITIKTVKNTVYREAKTFYDEVINTDYEGIVFFAHSKGYTNFNPETRYNKKYIIEWIIGCYWLSLEFLNEAEASLCRSTKQNNGLFYGSFKLVNKNGSVYMNSAYMGAFYWTNVRELKKYFSWENKDIPKLCSRMSAEEFPGIVRYNLPFDLISSHLFFGWFEDCMDGYGIKKNGISPEKAIETGLPDDYGNFCIFKNKILESIEETKQWI